MSSSGLSNELLTNLISTIGISDDFAGVIPHFELNKFDTLYEKKIFILNVGAHFVTLYISPKEHYALYIDPLGNKIHNKSVYAYLDNFPNIEVFFNRKQLQPYVSSHCGLYAVLFSVYFDRKDTDKKIKLHFSADGAEQNDEKCVKYLKQLKL